MKKSLSLIAAGLVATAATVTAAGQLTRDAGEPLDNRASQPRGVQIPPGLLKESRHQVSNSVLTGITADRRTPRRRAGNAGVARNARQAAFSSPSRVALQASSLQGYCTYSGTYSDIGWYDIDISGVSSLQWKRQGKFTPSAGFVRGDELYAFYTLTSSGSGLTDAGLMIIDHATGNIDASYPFDIYDTLEQVTVLAAYDSKADEAWVVTLDKTGSGAYMLKKFNPSTRTFTDLQVNVPATWLDMAWNSSDNSLYLFEEGGELKRYDAKAKRFTQVNSVAWDISEFPNDMVYSPKDDAFILFVDSYDEEDYPCTDVLLLPVSGKAQYVGTLAGNPQYRILHVSDSYVDAAGAKAPELTAWNVTGPALEGNFTVKLPSTYENGASISGQVYLQAEMDGVEQKGASGGAPGSTVTVPVSGTEGLHRFSVTPYTLSDDGKVFGTPLVFDKCLGNDEPVAPADVILSGNTVTWSAVTTGLHDGYLNLADMKYNVYVDKVLMNEQPVAGTSLSFTMPSTGVVAHRAEVYAICSGKISEPGVSGKYYADGALELPVFIGVDEGESDLDKELIDMFTVVKDPLNTQELRGWRYDDQNEHTGGFYCLCPSESSTGDTADEWIFLPAINFTDANAHYRFSMDVWSGNHPFTSPETYEVAISKRPSRSKAITVKDAATVYKSPYFEQSETIFQVPEAGEWYIGIRYISPIGSYRLYARNFKVEKANASSGSPAAVTELRSVAAPKGELKADLSFKMPLLSISGSELDKSEVITAKAVSEAGEASVSGKPGDAVSLSVPTRQGDNIITVTTSSAKGEGLLAETTVYCGVYRPDTPDASLDVPSDNMSLTINVSPKELNEKGEYAGPDDQDVTIYRNIGTEWRAAAEIGKNRSWTFNCPDEKQALYMFGVGASNAAGSCEEMITFPVHLGTPHQLPMFEPFKLVGENVDLAYEPLSNEQISYLPSTWGVDDPTVVDPDATNGSGTALIVLYEGESRIHLPRFSTVGKHNVKVDLKMFFGNLTAERVSVLAASPSQPMTEIAVFTPESGNGWENKIVSLPSSCQNQGWVQVYLQVQIVGYNQCFILESYAVKDYPSEMLTITGVSGPARTAVGNTEAYEFEVENCGTSDVTMPRYTFKAVSPDGDMPYVAAETNPTQLKAGEKGKFRFSITPKAADLGQVNLSFSIEGQPEVAVSKMQKTITVVNARIPVVQDLAIAYGDTKSDVALSWSKPRYTEDFEAAEPWSYAESIRGFRNLDLDGTEVWTIEELSFPGTRAPKAYQVFSSTITENPLFESHSGEQYLLCMSPKTGETNDWLISPEVKGGTPLSFWMNICNAEYAETLLVKYSTTGNNPEDFTNDVNGGYICPDARGWKKYEFTLPADAKYFALHHVGEDGYEQFGFMIDDICFEPKSGAPAVEGYNLYRDGELIAAGLTGTAYVDHNIDTEIPTRYFVKTISTVNGEKVESDRSNVVWTSELSGVEDINAVSASISGGKGVIMLQGFSAGTECTVTDAAGITVAVVSISSDNESIHVAPGVYIVKAGTTSAKLLVK